MSGCLVSAGSNRSKSMIYGTSSVCSLNILSCWVRTNRALLAAVAVCSRHDHQGVSKASAQELSKYQIMSCKLPSRHLPGRAARGAVATTLYLKRAAQLDRCVLVECAVTIHTENQKLCITACWRNPYERRALTKPQLNFDLQLLSTAHCQTSLQPAAAKSVWPLS